MKSKHTGGCLCGAVRYVIDGELRDVIACHCSQCRRTSGHFVAATNAPKAALRLERADTLRWYRSSPAAERGFCGTCGGNLFWRPNEGELISIMAGTIDTPTELKIAAHIFVADKSDYYQINDGVPMKQGWN
jgi:hypothetical protein